MSYTGASPIGFGDTTPTMTPGVIATGQETLNAQVAVKLGQTSATVTHASLYPTFVGLYFFIVTVPSLRTETTKST